MARPHHLAAVGQDVVLDGGLSWSAKDPKHLAFQWILSDGTKADGPTTTCRYAAPGTYSEILKVSDADGQIDYDFAVVQVVDPAQPKLLPPTIHAVYWPTFDLKAGDEITFKVRSFRDGMADTRERWDFGDGSPPVEVQSLVDASKPEGSKSLTHAKDGYAVTKHRYAEAGHYLVSVSRANSRGQTATARLHVRIEPR